MINTRVHNHGPVEGPGTDCPERAVETTTYPNRRLLRGECVEDDGCSRGAHDPLSTVPRSGGCLEPKIPTALVDAAVDRYIADRTPGPLEATPRRVYLVHLLTDLMASLDVELNELAELERIADSSVPDAEHAADKLNAVWAKAAEARTAIRSTDLGYMPLPEVG